MNLFQHLSFNVGPTLLSWLETHHRDVYDAMVAADRAEGRAIAQGFGHAILPLCSDRDLRTQVRWASPTSPPLRPRPRGALAPGDGGERARPYRELGEGPPVERFLTELARARSNDPAHGDGRRIWVEQVDGSRPA